MGDGDVNSNLLIARSWTGRSGNGSAGTRTGPVKAATGPAPPPHLTNGLPTLQAYSVSGLSEGDCPEGACLWTSVTSCVTLGISVPVHLHNRTDANTTWPLCLALWMGDAVKFPGSCEDMEVGNLTETWYQSLQSMLKALNQTLHGAILCPPDQATGRTNGSHVKLASKDDYSYMYILFVMILFAATVGSLILGYTKSRRVDKRSDPCHVYIKIYGVYDLSRAGTLLQGHAQLPTSASCSRRTLFPGPVKLFSEGPTHVLLRDSHADTFSAEEQQQA